MLPVIGSVLRFLLLKCTPVGSLSPASLTLAGVTISYAPNCGNFAVDENTDLNVKCSNNGSFYEMNVVCCVIDYSYFQSNILSDKLYLNDCKFHCAVYVG